MQAIIGLGNPGDKYKNTRHNIGFTIIDQLTSDLEGDWTHLCDSEIFTTQINNIKTLLVKPQTFMNNSGKALKCLYKKNDLNPQDISVIYDDVDLPFSEVRVRKNGGTGGHNGIESIVSELRTQDFIRIRIGIGRPEDTKKDIADFVLEEFTQQEKKALKHIIDNATQKTRRLLRFGYEEFTSKYNS